MSNNPGTGNGLTVAAARARRDEMGQAEGNEGKKRSSNCGGRMGQNYEFGRSQIVDWTFVDTRSNKMIGNYTACALLTREPPDQAAAFRRQYGLDCNI